MNKLILMILSPVLLFAQGSLMLVGGGSENYNSWSDIPYQWFVNQADSGIIVNIDVDEASDWYSGYFESLGADSDSRALQIASESAANDSAVYNVLVEASGIFMEGGDQWDYVSTWKNSLVADAIKKVYAEGGVIGGTSAGLAVLGSVYFDAKFGSSYPNQAAENCRHPDIHLDNNLFDLMPGVLTDSHFHPRGRIGRLIPMMAKWKIDTGEFLTGIGVDDKTAFCIAPNNQGTVYGKGSVTIVSPTAESTVESIAGESVHYRDLRLDQLVHGLSFDLTQMHLLNAEKLTGFDYEEPNHTYSEIVLQGNDDSSLEEGTVVVENLTSSATNAWYGRLSLSEGTNSVPNSVIINKIWDDDDYYENRFVGGLYAIAENPGITAIYLGENSSLTIDNTGQCSVENYAYFIDSRPMTYYGFPQQNDPTAPVKNSNHPAIINARMHFLKEGETYDLDYVIEVGIKENFVPREFNVGYNFPNPFNGETRLKYSIKIPSKIAIQIFDIRGNQIASRFRDHHNAGTYAFTWRGKDQQGKPQAAGVYYIAVRHLQSRSQVVRKLAYLK